MGTQVVATVEWDAAANGDRHAPHPVAGAQALPQGRAGFHLVCAQVGCPHAPVLGLADSEANGYARHHWRLVGVLVKTLGTVTNLRPVPKQW